MSFYLFIAISFYLNIECEFGLTMKSVSRIWKILIWLNLIAYGCLVLG